MWGGPRGVSVGRGPRGVSVGRGGFEMEGFRLGYLSLPRCQRSCLPMKTSSVL